MNHWHLQDLNTVTRQYPQFPMAYRRLVSRHHGQLPVAHRPSVPPRPGVQRLPPPASFLQASIGSGQTWGSSCGRCAAEQSPSQRARRCVAVSRRQRAPTGGPDEAEGAIKEGVVANRMQKVNTQGEDQASSPRPIATHRAVERPSSDQLTRAQRDTWEVPCPAIQNYQASLPGTPEQASTY